MKSVLMLFVWLPMKHCKEADIVLNQSAGTKTEGASAMPISAIQATWTDAPDASTATASPAAKSKVAASSAVPQDTVRLSSRAQPSPAGTINVAPPALVEVEGLLTRRLTAGQIATSLKIPLSFVEVDAEIAQSPAATGSTELAAESL
jgi:hypothetical protein